MKLTTMMGFGVGMATTIIAAKAMESNSVKAKTRAIKKKIARVLD